MRYWLWVLVVVGTAAADPPPLRQQLSLNGDWPEGGRVPIYGGEPRPVKGKTYSRRVGVPPEFAGKRILLEFTAVNFACDVLVNGRQIGSHVGAWVPFSFDLTDQVTPGTDFALQVRVEGMTGPRTLGSDGWERWPIGGQKFDDRWTGIADDVWLRAYGDVSIRDTAIRPRVSQGLLEVEYTVVNSTDRPRRVALQPSVSEEKSTAGTSAKTWPASDFELAAGEQKQLRVELPWSDARRWTPDTPDLYVLETQLIQDGQTLDSERRRFGYREFVVSGDRFALNGVPTTLRGDYIGYGGYIPVTMQTKENLPSTYRRLKDELGANALRWHMRPSPTYCYDLADEIGLLIVCESAVYGRPDERGRMPPGVKAEFLANVHRWLPAWVTSHRNHPSIVMWSPVNEMGPKYKNHQGLTVDELKAIGSVVRQIDRTRPIVYHGNAEVRDEDVVSYHYPGLPPEKADGNIYQWRRLLVPGKPVAVGEYFQSSETAPGLGPTPAARRAKAEQAKDWLGLFNRGLRYIGVADYRPKTLFWTLKEPPGSWRVETIRNTNSAVALFDRDYDELGIAPWKEGRVPTVKAGTTVPRRLVLFNEDWTGDQLHYEVEIRQPGQMPSISRGEFVIPPGHRREWVYDLAVPNVSGEFTVTRRVFKEGRLRFEETRTFRAD